VFEKIVRRLLGNTALAVQGETSEAGIRQTLGHDALPVVFDESEGADRKANERMQSVMALMRSASAEDGGVMAKGSATGLAKTYRIRSCFAFASIAVQIAQQSDRTRVSIIGLKRDLRADRDERWAETVRMYHELLTDEYVERLQSRTIKLLPTILKNAETFASAGAAELGTQRMGDQIGSLLAGVYSLFASDTITYDKATEWIRQRDWSEERGIEGQADEVRILQHLMEQIVHVDATTGRYERTVGELIMIAADELIDGSISERDARTNIARLGFKVYKEAYNDWTLLVSNKSVWISKTLANTAWPNNHHTILQRIKGAQKGDSTQFSPGVRQRCTIIPFSSFREKV
jgi:putative DNA primase/helicase